MCSKTHVSPSFYLIQTATVGTKWFRNARHAYCVKGLSLSTERSYSRKLKSNLEQDGLTVPDRECRNGITNFWLVTVEHTAERHAHSGGY